MSIISLLEKNSRIFNIYITFIIDKFYSCEDEMEQDLISILKNLETYEQLRIAFPEWEIIENPEIIKVKYPHVINCKQWQENGKKFCCSSCSTNLLLPLNLCFEFKSFFETISKSY